MRRREAVEHCGRFEPGEGAFSGGSGKLPVCSLRAPTVGGSSIFYLFTFWLLDSPGGSLRQPDARAPISVFGA